ncbi:helix-turn-helix domain-containing protein [Yinghuangia seranimata]|uniref:helix-turn-helix domain-containing protein n=1 Tax=Yinghuangia seranimata TaxID=408067 RepID=UPI00248A9671|nr:helix-turn-helix transcriptional regulator [Yinghuangia seranimata]MDI2131652.1 helix-turn-helix transcriptional regulator [Yinghuangia seranimata]
MTQPSDPGSPPPFDPAAARTARAVMALTPERVAASLASYGVNVFPTDVRAWEAGTAAPDEHELIGLARTLAVPVERLLGAAPTTLQLVRIRTGLTRAEAGRKVGMSEATWARMERTNCWRADERRTEALVRTFGGLSHRDLVDVSGASDELARLLAAGLAQGRWSAQLSGICEVLGTRRRRISEALDALTAEFPPPAEKPEGEPVLPPGAADRFWGLLGDPAADPFAPGAWRRPPNR